MFDDEAEIDDEADEDEGSAEIDDLEDNCTLFH